jgi:Putative beta barrel porin-7 (BBP7)
MSSIQRVAQTSEIGGGGVHRYLAHRIRVAALSSVLLGAFADAGIAADNDIRINKAPDLSPLAHTSPVPDMPRKAAPPAPVNTLHAWIAADYLGWWTKGAKMPPLVTTGDPASANAGALGDPTTQILFGGSDFGKTILSGLRVRAGAAISDSLAVEAGGFVLQNRSAGFSAQSDGAGSPLIARPVILATTGSEGSYADSFAGFIAGGVNVDFKSSFYGLEANAARRLPLFGGPLEVDLLAGIRYLHLDERLQVDDNFAALVPGILTFLGNPADPPSTLTDFDRFRTANDFVGAQIGARGKLVVRDWELGASGKLALGATYQTVDIQGATTLNTPGAPAVTAPGGVLAQATNIGRYHATPFTVVPELELSAGYQIFPGVTIRAGYNLIYWSNVVRVNNQIDRTVNPGIVPSDATFGTPGGPARPAFNLNQTNFWAQGLTIGLQYRL